MSWSRWPQWVVQEFSSGSKGGVCSFHRQSGLSLWHHSSKIIQQTTTCISQECFAEETHWEDKTAEEVLRNVFALICKQPRICITFPVLWRNWSGPWALKGCLARWTSEPLSKYVRKMFIWDYICRQKNIRANKDSLISQLQQLGAMILAPFLLWTAMWLE